MKTLFETLAIVPMGGGASISFTFTSECVKGQQVKVKGHASGFAVGLGWKAGATISLGKYDDGKINVDSYQFQGAAKFVSAGAAISLFGVGASALQLGEARIFSAGWQTGFDFSVMGGAGFSSVDSVKKINCGCN